MWPSTKGRGDVEAGSRPLYPMMLKSPEIYAILTVQLLLTVAVAGVFVAVRPISHFFVSSVASLVLYVFLLILPFIDARFFCPYWKFSTPCFWRLLSILISAVLCPLYYYHQKHPVNMLLLGVFTVAIISPLA